MQQKRSRLAWWCDLRRYEAAGGTSQAEFARERGIGPSLVNRAKKLGDALAPEFQQALLDEPPAIELELAELLARAGGHSRQRALFQEYQTGAFDIARFKQLTRTSAGTDGHRMIQLTLNSGRVRIDFSIQTDCDLAELDAALKEAQHDVRMNRGRSVEEFRTYLRLKSTAARKSAEAQAAQEALKRLTADHGKDS